QTLGGPSADAKVIGDAYRIWVDCRIGNVGDDLSTIYAEYGVISDEQAREHCGEPLDLNAIYGWGLKASKLHFTGGSGFLYTIDDNGTTYGLGATSWGFHDIWPDGYAMDWAEAEDGTVGGGELGHIDWQWNDSLYRFEASGS